MSKVMLPLITSSSVPDKKGITWVEEKKKKNHEGHGHWSDTGVKIELNIPTFPMRILGKWQNPNKQWLPGMPRPAVLFPGHTLKSRGNHTNNQTLIQGRVLKL